ncbi:hypothetical protein V8F06_006466 [Rhypophila decipiens]
MPAENYQLMYSPTSMVFSGNFFCMYFLSSIRLLSIPPWGTMERQHHELPLGFICRKPFHPILTPTTWLTTCSYCSHSIFLSGPTGQKPSHGDLQVGKRYQQFSSLLLCFQLAAHNSTTSSIRPVALLTHTRAQRAGTFCSLLLAGQKGTKAWFTSPVSSLTVAGFLLDAPNALPVGCEYLLGAFPLLPHHLPFTLNSPPLDFPDLVTSLLDRVGYQRSRDAHGSI